MLGVFICWKCDVLVVICFIVGSVFSVVIVMNVLIVVFVFWLVDGWVVCFVL